MSRSTRDRIPTGRTNISNNSETSREKINTYRDRSAPTTFRNSAKFTFSQKSEKPTSKGPFSPRYLEPILHPQDPTKKRILQCPDEFLHTNQEHELDLNIPKLGTLAVEERGALVSSFIARNGDNMWKYDPSFRGKSQQEIYDNICNKKDFASSMAKYSNLEKKFNLSTSSNHIKSCLHQGDVTPLHQPTNYDPFLSSIQTTRTAREDRVRALFGPSLSQHVNMNPRGEKHAVEWGNFSSFVGHLKKNEMAMIKR
mmetsp:Transcript_17439/g.17533  ORF Transcript_17439/g.17533 Transcript_17439/m.17533 type:complete len:255 (-) Transcript_17439:79-843(-)